MITSMNRFMRCLVFSVDTEKVMQELLDIDATNIIIRSHTDCNEIDFRVEAAADMSSLRPGHYGIISVSILMPNHGLPPQEFGPDFLGAVEITANWLVEHERFWEVHEVLEELWHLAKGKLKDYYHGITLLAVANVQAQTNRLDIARATYSRALFRIASSGTNAELLQSLPQQFSYPTVFRFQSLGLD